MKNKNGQTPVEFAKWRLQKMPSAYGMPKMIIPREQTKKVISFLEKALQRHEYEKQRRDPRPLHPPSEICIPTINNDLQVSVLAPPSLVEPTVSSARQYPATNGEIQLNETRSATRTDAFVPTSSTSKETHVESVGVTNGSPRSVLANNMVAHNDTAATTTSGLPVSPDGKFQIYADAVLSESDENDFPLHAAVKFGYANFVEEELEKETSGDIAGNENNSVVNTVDRKGRTALDLAALTGQLILIARLREAGGVFRYKNGPRMMAIGSRRSKVVEKYLEQVREAVE